MTYAELKAALDRALAQDDDPIVVECPETGSAWTITGVEYVGNNATYGFVLRIGELTGITVPE